MNRFLSFLILVTSLAIFSIGSNADIRMERAGSYTLDDKYPVRRELKPIFCMIQDIVFLLV